MFVSKKFVSVATAAALSFSAIVPATAQEAELEGEDDVVVALLEESAPAPEKKITEVTTEEATESNNDNVVLPVLAVGGVALVLGAIYALLNFRPLPVV